MKDYSDALPEYREAYEKQRIAEMVELTLKYINCPLSKLVRKK